ALLFGVCTGVALLTPGDSRACHGVHTALQSVFTKNPLLSRAHFALVVDTDLQWNVADQLHERVTSLLHQLQLKTVDMLLLKAQSLAIPVGASTSERKRIVLHFWDQMVALQQSGLVAQIGVSDFSTQQIEFILTAFPENPPVALSLAVVTPMMTTDSSAADEPLPPSLSAAGRLAPMVSFAHGRAMDVLVRFPLRALETITPLAARDQWTRLAHAIAHRHRERKFQFPTINEADSEPFQLQTRSMADTSALQSPVQIIMRFLLQKGLVVVPIAVVSEGEPGFVDGAFEDDECQELFYALLHPFTALAPSSSAHKLYSSLLSSDDLAAVDQTLQLGYCATPQPTPQ
ncbi:hypothetical protein Gpo141_00014783, partial [Globisporangium polare]